VPLSVGELSPHLTRVVWAEAYLCSIWYPNTSSHLATIDMGQKVGGAGSLSNTRLPGPRPTSVSSGILIHPTVSLQ